MTLGCLVHDDPVRVTESRYVLIMRGVRVLAAVMALRNSSATSRSRQAPTRCRCDRRRGLQPLDMLKTVTNSMEPAFDEHAALDDLDLAEYCPLCEAPGVTTILHQDSFDYRLRGGKVTLHATIPVRCCGACEFEYIDDEGAQIKHAAVCKHLGVLSPTEVRAIREGHGLNRETFARITGLEEATLEKWERGALIQNRADDNYLRLLESPENLPRLRGDETRAGSCDRN